MTLYRVEPAGNDAGSTMEAIRQRLAEGDGGAGGRTQDPRIQALREYARLDPLAVPPATKPYVGTLVTSLRRLIVQLTWWRSLPAWGQVAGFARGSTDLIERILDEQAALRRRIERLEEELQQLRRSGKDG